jgi:cobalt-zinc-cadmium efflux system outer membrane protein
VSAAVEANPGVQALRRRYEAMLERPAQERALPDPMAAYAFMFRDVVTANGPVMRSVEVSQEIPFPGKRRLRAAVSEAEAEAAEQAWRSARLEVAYRVRSAYYELLRIDRSLDTLRQEAEVLDRLERAAAARYSAALASQGDVLRAQTERSRIEERRILLRHERDAAAARWNAVLDRPQSDPVGRALDPPSPAPPPAPEEVERTARESRPEVREAARLVAAGRQRIDLARRDFFPDLRLSFQWNQIGPTLNPFAPEPGRDAFMLMAGVNLPIRRGKLRAAVREAEAMTAMAESEERERGNQAAAEARAALALLRARGELAALYERTLIPQAESSLRSAESAYQTGRMDFLSVLDSERAVLDLRLAHAVALADLGEARAGLERAVGRELGDLVASARPESPEGGVR